VVIATLSGVRRYHTFQIRVVAEGHQITPLIDSGSTDNFIDTTLVDMNDILTKEFEGFSVEVADRYTLECSHMITELHVMLGSYTLTDDFYMVDLVDTNIVLGIY
jgi:hypothetical protein